MNNPKFETPDLTAENIAALFHGMLVEGKLNFGLLRSITGRLN